MRSERNAECEVTKVRIEGNGQWAMGNGQWAMGKTNFLKTCFRIKLINQINNITLL